MDIIDIAIAKALSGGEGGGGSSGGGVVVRPTNDTIAFADKETGADAFTCAYTDKTIDELKAAFSSGKPCFFVDESNNRYQMIGACTDDFAFAINEMQSDSIATKAFVLTDSGDEYEVSYDARPSADTGTLVVDVNND